MSVIDEETSYTQSPLVYCPGAGCCRRYEITAHWEYRLEDSSEWECPNGHLLRITDEDVVRHWSWRLVDRPVDRPSPPGAGEEPGR